MVFKLSDNSVSCVVACVSEYVCIYLSVCVCMRMCSVLVRPCVREVPFKSYGPIIFVQLKTTNPLRESSSKSALFPTCWYRFNRPSVITTSNNRAQRGQQRIEESPCQPHLICIPILCQIRPVRAIRPFVFCLEQIPK